MYMYFYRESKKERFMLVSLVEHQFNADVIYEDTALIINKITQTQATKCLRTKIN